MTAFGKALEPAYRSKLERDYASHLDVLLRAGAIREWWFEAMTFRLGHDCRYTPDFAVQLPDLSIEMHEVKGARRWDGAMEKVRTACEMFPFVFRLVTRSKEGEWEIREVGAPAKKPRQEEVMTNDSRRMPKVRKLPSGNGLHVGSPREGVAAAPQSKPRMALLNGKEIPLTDALKMVRGEWRTATPRLIASASLEIHPTMP